MTDRNGWTLWNESPPPKSEDNLLVVRTRIDISYEYHCVAWVEAAESFLSLHYPVQPFFASDNARWKAVPYPALVESLAKSAAASRSTSS